MTEPNTPPARAGESADNAREAQRDFTEWFVQNYPSRCIITNPEWHAEKIFRAARRALDYWQVEPR